MIELNRIYNEDCLEGMKLLDDNSIDSIVTDPPYEIGFMGKKWDSTGIAYNVDVWKECLRILKPGGHLLAFGGTRTYHRMACAIEDAGFEIRDQIMWIYGSGFPKSMNISKTFDKKEYKLNATTETLFNNPNGKRDLTKRSDYGYKFQPLSDNAKKWNGWGTALKPANEPIVLARKPISEKTIAENVLKWGTGGINIDGCRIPTDETITNHSRSTESSKSKGKYGDSRAQETHQTQGQKLGRFPANVILDEEAGCMLDEQQEGASRFFYCAKASKKERNIGLEGVEPTTVDDGRNKPIDNPFLRGKTPRQNTHPTVKPVKLMEYLVTLITPPNGTVLDPFMGSGTTAIACINTNRNYIGFELDKHYCDIATERIQRAMQDKAVGE